MGSTEYNLQGEGEFCYPLYTGGTITLGLSLLLIMSFVTNHGITDAAWQDLLTIISLHCPSNLCVTSPYKFKQFFLNKILV